MAEIDVAERRGDAGEGRAPPRRDADVSPGVFGAFPLAVEVVVEVGHRRAQVLSAGDRRVFLIPGVGANLLDALGRLGQQGGGRRSLAEIGPVRRLRGEAEGPGAVHDMDDACARDVAKAGNAAGAGRNGPQGRLEQGRRSLAIGRLLRQIHTVSP